MAYVREVGFARILVDGTAAAERLPADLVYVGVSLGVLPAQKLAQTRPGARAAVLAEGCFPMAEFGGSWPAGVPVQVHGKDADPSFVGEGDIESARELVASTDRGELFLYPGERHLFTDASLSGYDPEASALFTRRVLELLAEVG
jgi:dienelactone hydrolase